MWSVVVIHEAAMKSLPVLFFHHHHHHMYVPCFVVEEELCLCLSGGGATIPINGENIMHTFFYFVCWCISLLWFILHAELLRIDGPFLLHSASSICVHSRVCAASEDIFLELNLLSIVKISK